MTQAAPSAQPGVPPRRPPFGDSAAPEGLPRRAIGGNRRERCRRGAELDRGARRGLSHQPTAAWAVRIAAGVLPDGAADFGHIVSLGTLFSPNPNYRPPPSPCTPTA